MAIVPLFEIAYCAHIAATLAGMGIIVWITRRWPGSRPAAALLVLGCAAMAIASFLVSDPPRYFEDFRIAYYPAGKAILANTPIRPLMGMGVSGFVNMPAVAYLFAPLAMLPLPAAMALFTGMGLGAIAISWLLLVRMAGLNTTDRWLLALLFASSGPLQYSLKEGNTSHMVLAALAGALLLLRTGRSGLAGILLGMAAVLKPPILLLALFFAVRRDIRGLLGFVSSCVAAAALSLLLFGLADNLYWFNTCIVQFSHSWLAAFNVQSIPGFLFRLEASPALLLDWNAYAPPADLILPARILTVALFAIAGAVLLKNPPLPGATARRQGTVPCDTHYCLILCLAVVSSPLSWSHYYCWLLLPVAFFLSWRHALGWPARAPIWLAILLVTPLVRPLSFPQAWLNDGYKTFAVSHLLFGGLLCFALLAARLWRARSAASAASASQVIAQA